MNARSVRVFLVGVELKSRTASEVHESLAELQELAETAGAQIVGEGVQKLAAPVAATYIGGGKADELATLCKQSDVDTVIFDDELSPAQTAQPGENFWLQDHGSHRANPGNFRTTRPHA